ncbi:MULTISPECIES: hypothetical protein [Tsukamurella]|uniref:Uncharacterized protein n=2 Tax=Tsukamurella TaxID=2060 RepID=A0A5C5RYD3_9ACTN|nr:MULTISPECIES: hypothetical protein [Tsukamurella]NMD56555.1 hypothetical protein [Tsukamurella columbiensis]TWS27513.1 hypothetical protein FK530_18525 [Tsukamurella conjunctivitidis]
MAETEFYHRLVALLDAVDAEMAMVHEQVLNLMRKGAPEHRFDVSMRVSGRLEELMEAVDELHGYYELHPAALAARADRVVLVERSGPELVESTYSIEEWRTRGPAILTAALRLWDVAGGQVRLSGSYLRGRGTVYTQSGSYTARAWYAADAEGAIWPENEESTQ